MVACAARGLTKAEIGALLNLSENTVKTHLRRVAEKLKTNNVAHTVARCIALGDITPDGQPVLQEPVQGS